MKHPTLFEVPTDKPSRRQQITAFKREHGIWTHNAGLSREEHTWSAMLLEKSREAAGLHKFADAVEVIATYCGRLDEMRLLVTGTSEVEAIRNLCAYNDIPCDL